MRQRNPFLYVLLILIIECGILLPGWIADRSLSIGNNTGTCELTQPADTGFVLCQRVQNRIRTAGSMLPFVRFGVEIKKQLCAISDRVLYNNRRFCYLFEPTLVSLDCLLLI